MCLAILIWCTTFLWCVLWPPLLLHIFTPHLKIDFQKWHPFELNYLVYVPPPVMGSSRGKSAIVLSKFPSNSIYRKILLFIWWKWVPAIPLKSCSLNPGQGLDHSCIICSSAFSQQSFHLRCFHQFLDRIDISVMGRKDFGRSFLFK